MKLRLLAFAFAIAVCAPPAGAQAQRVPPPPPPPLPDQPATVGPAPSTAPAPSRPAAPASAQPTAPAGALTRSATGAEARAAEPPPTRWQADLDRLDGDLRLRLLTAKDPRTDWLAGEVDTTDIESQVRHFTAARTAAPDDRLYLSALGIACLQPTRPSLAQCDAVDRLSDWARRDTDNGVPSILLAGRARQRGEADSAVMFVEQAAMAPRFDDYWSQGAQRWWDYLRTLEVDVDPAAKAKAAWNYAAAHDIGWAAPLRALCAEPAQRVERMRAACASLGQAMMTRGATYALRRAGARVAELNAADAAARTTAQSRNARIVEASARCAQAQPDFAAALESPQAPVRAGGVEQFGAWAAAQARDGEVGACEKLLASAPRR